MIPPHPFKNQGLGTHPPKNRKSSCVCSTRSYVPFKLQYQGFPKLLVQPRSCCMADTFASSTKETGPRHGGKRDRRLRSMSRGGTERYSLSRTHDVKRNQYLLLRIPLPVDATAPRTASCQRIICSRSQTTRSRPSTDHFDITTDRAGRQRRPRRRKQG